MLGTTSFQQSEEEATELDIDDTIGQNTWSNHGYVFSLGDGIIVVHGLYRVTAGEWLYLIVRVL